MHVEDLLQQMRRSHLIAVIRGSSPDDARAKAERALKAGVEVLEIAWTTPNADEVIRSLKPHRAIVGAGTVLTAKAAELAVNAGAEFLFAPNYSADVLAVAQSRSVVYIPGVLTPRDVADALAAGLKVLKLFPAASGGIAHFKALREPFPGLEWIPTGGVTWETVDDWIAHGAVGVGMGSALFNHADLANAVKRLQDVPR